MSRTTVLRVIALAAVFLGIPLYWWAFPPRLPIGTANGIYANACCGSLKLRDGLMSFGENQHVSYVVEYDKIGRYVLPLDYVGVLDGSKIAADESGYAFKLRLDESPMPTTIQLIGGSLAYDFRRVEKNGS